MYQSNKDASPLEGYVAHDVVVRLVLVVLGYKKVGMFLRDDAMMYKRYLWAYDAVITSLARAPSHMHVETT